MYKTIKDEIINDYLLFIMKKDNTYLVGINGCANSKNNKGRIWYEKELKERKKAENLYNSLRKQAILETGITDDLQKLYEFICPLCKERTNGIGHVYKKLRICDDCYCDIKGIQKVNIGTIYRT